MLRLKVERSGEEKQIEALGVRNFWFGWPCGSVCSIARNLVVGLPGFCMYLEASNAGFPPSVTSSVVESNFLGYFFLLRLK